MEESVNIKYCAFLLVNKRRIY